MASDPKQQGVLG